MCASCGFPAATGHWTDAGAASAFDRLRGRLRRASVLRALLSPYGLVVHDDGSSLGFILSTKTGQQIMVANLTELWAVAERMAGRPVDPLEPRFTGDAS